MYLKRNIIHILPTLPPKINGVGDFGYILAEGLYKQLQIKSEFLISDTSYTNNQINYFNIHKFSKIYFSFYNELKKIILEGSDIILVHYVNYAYQKRGVPYYFFLVLNRIKKEFKEVSIIINFHELYARGNFPSSSFFLYPLQKKIFENLVDIGDIFFTSMNKYASIISGSDKTKSKIVNILPVFSNVGEMQEYIPLDKRNKQIVVFGSKGQRLCIYERHFNQLIEICKKFEIDNIIDIGEQTGFRFNNDKKIHIYETGKLNPEEINNYLSSSIAGAIFYPAAYLAKSSAFAAYASYGLAVFCFTDDNINEDGLVDGFNFFSSKNINNFNSLNVISKNVFDWYKKHSISIHSEFYKSILMDK